MGLKMLFEQAIYLGNFSAAVYFLAKESIILDF